MKKIFKKIWIFILWFFEKHQSLSVHYNKYNQEGEIIDVLVRKFEVRRFYTKTPKYMKFKTMNGKKVEIRTNSPMDYVVEDL